MTITIEPGKGEWSQDMPPRLSMHDESYIRGACSKLPSQIGEGSPCRVLAPNVANVVIGEYRARMVLSAQASSRISVALIERPNDAATLTHRIAHVVGLGSEEQMIGVDAGRDITLVEHPKTIGDCPFVDYPRDAVSADFLGTAAPGDHSISETRSCGGPQPTTRRIAPINLFPEPLRERTRRPVGLGADAATKLSATVGESGGGCKESRAATTASDEDRIESHRKLAPFDARGGPTRPPLIVSQEAVW